MQTKSCRYVRVLLLCVLAAALGGGCVTKDDPMAQADKKDVAKVFRRRASRKPKAIAEEGFNMACRS
jgi:hypothetical protein